MSACPHGNASFDCKRCDKEAHANVTHAAVRAAVEQERSRNAAVIARLRSAADSCRVLADLHGHPNTEAAMVKLLAETDQAQTEPVPPALDAMAIAELVRSAAAHECSTKCNEGCENRIDAIDLGALLADSERGKP